MTAFEKSRLRIISGLGTTRMWKEYFSLVLGRDVSLQETDEYLIEVSQRRAHGTDHSRRLPVTSSGV